MALTGIQIFKKLPKKNCGDCGIPTCLAFAMKVAALQKDIAECPFVDEALKTEVGEAFAPPVKQVRFGGPDAPFVCGGEGCLYRHEKRFENPTGIAVLVGSGMDEQEIERRLSAFNRLRYQRVGVEMRAELIALKDDTPIGQGGERCSHLTQKILECCPDAALILISRDSDKLKTLATLCGERKPLLMGADEGNWQQFARLSEQFTCPVGISAATLDEAIDVAEKLTGAGVKDIVIDSGARTAKTVFEDNVVARRAAVGSRIKSLGFPVINFPCLMTSEHLYEAMLASVMIAKYAGIVVLSDLRGETLFPLLLERLNLYTDPQRPMVVQEGIYPINGPDESSPIIVTCNFSLTYFIVSGEIESSRKPSWLLIKDTEGLSVLTAWAAGKFGADNIAGFLKNSGLSEKVGHRDLIIPGYVASIKGELEEELPDWHISVGPREAVHLPAFLKAWKPGC